MKAKKIRTMLVAFVAAGTVAPIFAQAESLESLQEQESAVLQQSQAISAEVQIALTDVNHTYSEVESLKAQIAENEETLAQTKADIATAQETIEKREAVVAERMKEIQVNGGATRDWTVLLESANIQDFINRAYAMTMLQNLEKEKLETLQDKAETTQTNLTADQQSLEEQAQALDSKISNLQAQLKDNESTLAQIASSKEAEESRLAAEKAAKEKAAKEAEEQAKAEAEAAAKAEAESTSQAAEASSSTSSEASSSTSSSSTSSTSSNNSSSSSDNTSSSSSNDTSNSGSTSGKTMMMESTAYSYAEAGASYFTASGTDLRKNPMAVAVDPSVIPLGTLVNVEGYGVALALDTGGAIKGNIIDVHFDNVDECKVWGRRQVKVTILD